MRSRICTVNPTTGAIDNSNKTLLFWLKDESLGDTDNLPPPHEIAIEIVENLEAALEQFRAVAEELGGEAAYRSAMRSVPKLEAGFARTAANSLR